MEKPTANISVISANYNNAKFLNDFIQSFIDSTFLPKELIIVDDGSSDNSLEILEHYEGHPFIKIVRLPENKGFAHALNAGIESATGKYIMRIDPDDILIKNRIEVQFKYMESHPEVDVLGSNVIYFNSNTLKELNRSNFPLEHEEIKKTYLKGEHGIQHPASMIKTEVMKKYRYIQENVPAEDYEIFANMLKDGYQFKNLATPLLKMRVHDASASSNLKFNTILKTFQIRDSIFKTNTRKLKIKFYFFYIFFYRKYLMSENLLKRITFIALSSFFYPQKLLRRLV